MKMNELKSIKPGRNRRNKHDDITLVWLNLENQSL